MEWCYCRRRQLVQLDQLILRHLPHPKFQSAQSIPHPLLLSALHRLPRLQIQSAQSHLLVLRRQVYRVRQQLQMPQ